MSNDFYGTVKDIAVPTYDQGGYDGPPRFYWHNGSKAIGSPGSFYIKADELRGEVPGAPWVACEKFQGEAGFTAESLKLAPIGYRQQAFRMEGDTKVWLPEWTEGARFQTELLCLVEGIEAAPLVWVAKGLIGKAITGKGTGILSVYREDLLGPAAKLAGKASLPLWTFWLPIGTRRAQGQVIYETVPGYAKVVITPPVVHAGIAKVDQAIERLFVGDKLYLAGAAIREEYDAWLKQRRGGVEATEQASDDLFEGAAPAVTTTRRAPVNEEDMPF